MRTHPVLIVLLAAACSTAGAPARGPSQSAPAKTTETIVTGGGSKVQINTVNIDTDVRLFSTGTPAQVVSVLPAVYADLGIPLTVNDAARRTVGNAGWKTRRSIGKVPMYRYLDCGSSGTMKNAETYQISMSVITTVRPNEGGGSVVATAITATGKNPVTSSSAEVRCASLGDLEIRIRDMAQKRIEAM